MTEPPEQSPPAWPRVRLLSQLDRRTLRSILYTAVTRSKLESTVRYLGIEVDDALEMAEQMEV